MIIVINVVLLAMLGALIVHSMLPKARTVVVRGAAAWLSAFRRLSTGAAAKRMRRLWWRATSRAGTAAGPSQQGPSTIVGRDGVKGCIEEGGGGAQ